MLELYEQFWQQLSQLEFTASDIDLLKNNTELQLKNPIQGDYPQWLQAYKSLPDITQIQTQLNQAAITCEAIEKVSIQLLKDSYQQLIPWRKGPFAMFGVNIDAEWQSNMKWQRMQKHIPDISNKLVLDVGCGNGYYMFRMAAEKPKLLMGIDPGLLQVMQFWSIEKYVQTGACVLPLSMQQIPQALNKFDVAFSMGVLYHRKSPIKHLTELANSLKTNGHLIIETLVVDGGVQTCLIPTNRYAQMRNVWFLPSVKMLKIMLQRIGFHNIKCIDETITTSIEQRTTDWMKFHSLEQFLNETQTKTIEGYALPKRATLVAQIK